MKAIIHQITLGGGQTLQAAGIKGQLLKVAAGQADTTMAGIRARHPHLKNKEHFQDTLNKLNVLLVAQSAGVHIELDEQSKPTLKPGDWERVVYVRGTRPESARPLDEYGVKVSLFKI